MCEKAQLREQELMKKLSGARQEVDEQRAQVKELQQLRTQNAACLENLQAEKTVELNLMNVELKQQKEKNKMLEDELHALKAALNTKDASMEQLQATVSKHVAQVTELEQTTKTKQKENDGLVKKIEAHQRDHSRLFQAADKSEKYAQHLQRQLAEKDALMSETESKLAELRGLTREFEGEKQEMRQTFQRQLKEATQAEKGLQEALSLAKLELDTLKEKKKVLDVEQIEQHNALKAARRENGECTDKLGKLRKELEDLNMRNQMLEKEVRKSNMMSTGVIVCYIATTIAYYML